MAGLKDIRTRIGSVKNTQKITSAMKLVSAAKFARAGQAVQASRPYAAAFDEMLGNLLSTYGDTVSSPLLSSRPVQNVLIVILGTDRGLCGGLNANLFKSVLKWQSQMPKNVSIEALAWGRKAVSFVKRNNVIKLLKSQEKVLEKPNYEFAKTSAKELVDLFLERKYDQIFLVYPKFVSAMAQIATVEQLLPVKISQTPSDAGLSNNFDVEPKFDEILDSLLERKLIGTIFKAMLESSASEHGARMSAMDSATRNAKEVVKKLTLKYNRARQAQITTELTEIISGAQALN